MSFMTKVGAPFIFLFATLIEIFSTVHPTSQIMSYGLFAGDKEAGGGWGGWWWSPSFTVQFCSTEPCGVKKWGKERKGGTGFEAGTRCQSKIPVPNTSSAKIFGVRIVMQVLNGFALIVVDESYTLVMRIPTPCHPHSLNNYC